MIGFHKDNGAVFYVDNIFLITFLIKCHYISHLHCQISDCNGPICTNHLHTGMLQHVIFTLLHNWIGFCHGADINRNRNRSLARYRNASRSTFSFPPVSLPHFLLKCLVSSNPLVLAFFSMKVKDLGHVPQYTSIPF